MAASRRETLALALGLAVTVAFVLDAAPARSDPAPAPASPVGVSSPALVSGSPIGRDFVRMLGPRAADVLAPTTGLIGALVGLPAGTRAESYGLEPVVPGIGRIRGTASKIDAFATAHPDLLVEAAPPLHPLLDRVGQWVASTTARATRGSDGTGVMVGVADTGIDITQPEMLDAAGHTRVAWLLDLSLKPQANSRHKDLEARFGIKGNDGTVVSGQVFDRTDLQTLLDDIKSGACDEKKGKPCAPTDEIGHGTHVAGIAASSGAGDGKYPGVAPKADIVFVRVTRGASDGIENDDLVRAVEFMFDRADADKQPMVVNLSLGSDFGPHDGTFLWEQAIAAHVGKDHPGRIVVAAAGNSGSIDAPIHQSVRVTEGTRMSVPVRTGGADAGSVQVWVTLRQGADLKIGLDGPDGEWIAPIEDGHQNGKNSTTYNAAVIYGAANGANNAQSPIPSGSHGAVIVWQGKWPAGTYGITFEGSGMAELYLQGLGDAGGGGDRPALFAGGVREGTINLPATHPAIIGVGCTVNRPRWTSIAGAEVALKVPILDAEGGLLVNHAITAQPAGPTHRDLYEGEVCWFSSAGPTAAGVPKPEISAPGALVISALSRNAAPGQPGSVFSSGSCPLTKAGAIDKRCLQIDPGHAIAVGTSMSSPVVAGVVALLLQADPTLTQDQVSALLQAGAHRYRTSTAFDDEGGPGEVDAMGSLDALDQMRNPTLHLPAAVRSWLTLSSDYVPADGSTPMTAIVELRTEDGQHRADLFDSGRLVPTILVDGQPVSVPPLVRRAPGVWVYAWTPPAGLGGSRATFGANFDGAPIVAPRSLPIAPDRWTALYPSHVTGSSCGVARDGRSGVAGSALACLAFVSLLRRASRASREAPTPRRPDRTRTPGRLRWFQRE